MQLRWIIGLLVAGALVAFLAGASHAQNVATDQGCNNPMINAQGSSGGPITVNNTAGGVTVLAASPRGSVCSAVICNSGATNSMNCAATDAPVPVTPTGSAGFPIAPNTCQPLGWESFHTWKCFSTSGTTANVIQIGLGPKVQP